MDIGIGRTIIGGFRLPFEPVIGIALQKPEERSSGPQFRAGSFVQRCQGQWRIEIIPQGIEQRRRWPRILAVARLQRSVQPIQFRLGLFQPLRRPIDRLAVVGLEHGQADGFAVMVLQQILHGDEVAEAFGHLLTFDHEIAVMHPHLGEAFVRVGATALGDLVFVVGEDQILAAAMDIEAAPKIFG